MRENRTPGSERGPVGNCRSYRDGSRSECGARNALMDAETWLGKILIGKCKYAERDSATMTA